jgi:hypothetical protein
MFIPHHISESLVKFFCGKKYLNLYHFSVADQDPGQSAFSTLDAESGMQKSDPG